MTSESTNVAVGPTRQLVFPLPPRRLSARGRRRSWNERPVRIWMILTVLVLLATAYVTARDVSSALRERRLIRDGLIVPAKVESVDGYSHADRSFSRESIRHVKLSYKTTANTLQGSAGNNEQALETEVDMPLDKTASITPGNTIDLRVDPDDSTHVTVETKPTDWLANLAVVTLFVAGLTLCILIVLWQQRRIIRIWREGEEVEGVVVDFQQASIAPRSRTVRFTLADSDDQRVFSTLWPNNAGELSAGDSIDLIAANGNGNRAIVAKLYL